MYNEDEELVDGFSMGVDDDEIDEPLDTPLEEKDPDLLEEEIPGGDKDS